MTPNKLTSAASRFAAGALLLGLLAGCDNNPVDEGDTDVEFELSRLTITLNPSGYAPLSAEAEVTTNIPVQIEVFVSGKKGVGSDVTHRFPGMVQDAAIPILGLYSDFPNVVTIRFLDSAGSVLADTTQTITTGPLLSDLPNVTIDAIVPSNVKPGMNLVSYFGHNGNFNPQRPFIFDRFGDIRWYLDFSSHPSLSGLFYDNGVERLANGNLYFGDRSTGRIVEMDMLGRTITSWVFPGYDFHHNVIEKPNGNFVLTVDKQGASTVEDYIIEIDRSSGAIVREWNLNQSLDYSRRSWPTSFANLNVDWFHGNGLSYDPGDNTIIVSGRTQGTVKLTSLNEVVWILAPHRGWAAAGDGTDLTTKLLQPVNAVGQVIPDAGVLEGTSNHPDFEWAWYQHAPKLMPDGSLLLFDNGDNRNYSDQELYSRAVVYEIDESAMTVKQTWQYGKERGAPTFSRIVSDVDYHADEDNIVFMPGAARSGGTSYGKMIEVDVASRVVVFEATITPPTAPFGITFHRVERLPLYSD